MNTIELIGAAILAICCIVIIVTTELRVRDNKRALKERNQELQHQAERYKRPLI